MTHWTTANIPSQAGRTAVVTGTGGLGLQEAIALARASATVIVAGRNADKGAEAVDTVRAAVPGAQITFEQLDLARLSSVRAFGERLRAQHTSLDLLINNAAVMTPPNRQLTADGFELQFGTNHLGHFALTAALLPLLRRGRDARVVSVSSVAARAGAIDIDNLQAERHYKSMEAYSQSKLACLMFAFELQRRSARAGWGVTSVASHPGIARTELLHNAPGRFSAQGLARTLLWFLFQPVEQGALPTLYAATSPLAQAGAYYGPHALGETRGFPVPAQVPPQALDERVAAQLWDRCEQLCGVSFS